MNSISTPNSVPEILVIIKSAVPVVLKLTVQLLPNCGCDFNVNIVKLISNSWSDVCGVIQ